MAEIADMTDEQILDLINRRERQMLIHSYLYYKMDKSIWTDAQFDTLGRELKGLIEMNPEIAKQAEWELYFRDWDATTGYHLPLDCPWVTNAAGKLLEIMAKIEGYEHKEVVRIEVIKKTGEVKKGSQMKLF